MKKRIMLLFLIAFFTLIMLVQMPFLTSADELVPTDTEKLSYETANNQVVITGCDADLTILIIPSVIDGCLVTGMVSNAFAYHTNLIAAVIPSTVTSISSSAFAYCSSLQLVTIESGVQTIASNAFLGCTALEQVTIGSGVQTIASNAFKNCTALTNITVPNSVTEIGASAFGGCSALQSMSLPFVGRQRGNNNTTEAIFGYIFGTSEFIGSTYVEMNYSGGNRSYFYVPDSLTTVTITDETVIGHGAFENCTMLTTVTLNNSITVMNNRAFYGCTGLTSLPVPSGVTVLNENVFAGCTSLPSVLSIPSGITQINSYAFRNCTGITSLTVPNSVTNIGEGAFNGCSSIVSITLPFVGAQRGVTENANNTTFGQIFGTSSYDGGLSVTMYHNSSNSRGFYIPQGLRSVTITDETVIPFGAFYNCSMLMSITYNDTVTAMGGYAFKDCRGVSTLAIPSHISILEEGVFTGCTGLPSTLVIPDNIQKICSYAFNGCTNLTSVTVPNSVTEIEYAAFTGCSNIASITLPFIGKERGNTGSQEAIFGYIFGSSSYVGGVSVTAYHNSSNSQGYFIPQALRSVTITDESVIGHGAFDGCSILTSITYPDTVTEVGGYAFRNCTGVSSLAIPSNISILETGVFTGCTGLPSTLVIPNNIQKICQYAFNDCTNLTSVTVPNSVTEIEDAAFKGCSNIASITLPFIGKERGNEGSREAIFGYIFGYSSYDGGVQVVARYWGSDRQGYFIPQELTSVTITDETVIPYGAFENCTMLTDITYDDKYVKTVSENAFTSCTAVVTAILPVNYKNADGTTATLNDAKQNGEVVVTAALDGMENAVLYVAMYDETGILVNIKMWNASGMDLFSRTVFLPQGKDIEEIKTLVLNNGLSPLLKAYKLD